MYSKFEKEIESCKNVVAIMFCIAILIWILNGGKNDFGLIHRVSLYMMLTCLVCTLLLLVSVVLKVIYEVLMWLVK